jgi:hypothetical protein
VRGGVVFVRHWTKKLLVPVLKPFKVRNPIPQGYADFYTVYYKDIGEFQLARCMLVTLVLIHVSLPL